MKKLLSCMLMLVSMHSIAFTDETVEAIGDTAGDVAELLNATDFKSDKTFQFSFNAIPSQMNQSVDNEEARSKIDDGAYHYEVGVLWRSNKKDLFDMTSSTQTYFSLHMLKYTQSGVDEEGYPWAEKTESTFFIYGNRFYSQKEYQGFGYGWYAGLGTSEANPGYWWYDGNTVTAYPYDTEDSGQRMEIIVAVEIFYKYKIENFFIAPRVAAGLNKKDFGFSIFPELMIGIEF